MEDEVGGTYGTSGEERGVYGVFVGRPKGKRPVERPRHRQEENIRMDLM
jgi:hypothetical protein